MRFIKNKAWGFASILGLLFAAIAAEIVVWNSSVVDAPFKQWMGEAGSDATETFWKTITQLGSTKFVIFVWLAASITFIAYRRWKTSLLFTATVLTAWLLNAAVKESIARERPSGHLVEADGFSFPSANAMVSVALYGILAYLVYKKLPPSLRWLAALLSTALILLIGISRIFLNVHYPSDILGGFLAGGAVMLFWIGVDVRGKGIRK